MQLPEAEYILDDPEYRSGVFAQMKENKEKDLYLAGAVNFHQIGMNLNYTVTEVKAYAISLEF